MSRARPSAELERLRVHAAACTRCELYAHATQTVFGEGPVPAPLMLMGEVPGDREDVDGHPFVGPAGRVLDDALAAAGIDRASAYLTNAVKHFKWRPAGKVRLHQKPNAKEVEACRVWWEAEVALVEPRLLCCLGATAAQAVFGSSFRVTRQRGTFVMLPSGVEATATLHPSAVLRAEDREEAFAGLVDDLLLVARRLERPS
jgi:uracil-DNA glycosylase family protein